MLNFIIEVILALLIVRTITNIIALKKQKGKINELQNKYAAMGPDELAALPDNEIVEGASYKVVNRYSKLHGGLGVLSEVEKNVLTFDQMKICCTTPGTKMSINAFFTDYTSLIINAENVFDILEEGKEAYQGAYQLYLKIEEEYKKDINEVLDEYDEPATDEKTFLDYTNDLRKVFLKEETTAKMAAYIRSHVNEFNYDPDEDDDDLTDFYDDDDEETEE